MNANKTLEMFFSEPFGASSKFVQKNVYDPNFATCLGDFNFDILLTVLDVFSFCFIFCWGVSSYKFMMI